MVSVKGYVAFLTQFLWLMTLSVQCQETWKNKSLSGTIQGEFIVEVSGNHVIESFLSGFVASRHASVVKSAGARQLMAQPFNLWLLSCDPTVLNPGDFETMVRGHREFIRVAPNRVLRQRKIPDDPDLAKQWQYINTGSTGGVAGADMDMDLAWDITTGGLTPAGDTIVVCIIDDGVNVNHEDLKSNLWVNRQEIPGNKVDDDANGYVDDYLGWNVVSANDTIFTDGGHGTPVAGIVGARGNNGIGVSGVNWNVKLMIVDYGSSTEANALASYGYAYAMRKMYNETNGAKGAFVVATNASWGIDDATADEAPLWCSVFDALGKIGILNCGATTNNDTDVDVRGDLPTSCTSDYLISVTNLNKSDVKVASAGYGRISIDLGSYGQGTYTLTRTGYGTFGGTSGATPHVTGVVGLLYSAPCTEFQTIVKNRPDKAALIARDMILHGVSPISGLQGITTTGGKLNAYRSLSNLMQICQPCSAPAGITITSGDSTVAVNWHTNTGSSEISVRYRKTNETSWKLIKDYLSGTMISGLDYCSEYELQVGSSCGFLTGSFSYSKFFTTTGCCLKPELQINSTSPNEISVGWDFDQNADFLMRYRIAGSEWKDTVISGSDFVLRGLNECTAATFSMMAMCQKYGNESLFSDQLNTSTDCGNCTNKTYCLPEKTDASQEWISLFRLNDKSNVSQSDGDGYETFAGFTDFSIEPNVKVNFKVGINYAGSSFKDFVRIYLDLNQNGVWEENENLFTTTSPVSDSITGVITVPEGTEPGWTRLRVILTYEDFSGGCYDPVFEYGETEDYCVRILENCPNDLTISATSESGSSLKFVCRATTKADTLQLRWRPADSIFWNITEARDSVVTLDGLDSCTWYKYQVRRSCQESGFSSWTPVDSIRTGCRINTEDPVSGLYLRPNPATDMIEIGYESGFSGKLTICGMDGIMRSMIAISGQNKVHLMPLNGLPPGVYIVTMELANKKQITRKLVKL